MQLKRVCKGGAAGLVVALAASVVPLTGGSPVAAAKTKTTNPACTPIPVKKHATVSLGWAGAFEVWAPILVAQAEGLFTKENITVNTSVVTGSNALVLLEKGQLDLELGGLTGGWLNGMADGTSYRIVAPGVELTPKSNGFYIDSKYFTSAGKLTVSAIKGTTIGISVGGKASSIAPGLNKALKKYGLTLTTFTVTQLISTTSLVGLKSGSLSGGYLNPPQSISFIKTKLGKQFWTFPAKTPFAAYLASGTAIAHQKPALQAFFRAIQCASSKYLSGTYHQRPAVVKIIATAEHLPTATVNNGPAQYSWPATLKFNPAGLLTVQKGWASFGGGILTYTKPLTLKQMVNQSVIPKIK